MRNLPMVKAGNHVSKQALCEFCNKRHGMGEDFCEMIVDGIEVNQSAENAKQVTLGQVWDLMEKKRPLIFAIVLKSSEENGIAFEQLEPKYRKFNFGGDDDIEDEPMDRSEHGLTITSCFRGYSVEETLGGDD